MASVGSVTWAPVLRRRSWLVMAVLPALAPAACGVPASLTPPALTGNPSPGERCAALMADAFPGGGIDVTGQNIVSDSVATVVVTVEGARSDVVPSAHLAREVAAECKFDHEVLLDFHFTKSPFR